MTIQEHIDKLYELAESQAREIHKLKERLSRFEHETNNALMYTDYHKEGKGVF